MKLPIWDWQILNQTNLPWRPLSIWNLPHTLSSWKLLMLWGPKSIDFNNFQFLWGVSHLKENMKRFLQCIISFFFMKIRKNEFYVDILSVSVYTTHVNQQTEEIVSVVCCGGDCSRCMLDAVTVAMLYRAVMSVIMLFAVVCTPCTLLVCTLSTV